MEMPFTIRSFSFGVLVVAGTTRGVRYVGLADTPAQGEEKMRREMRGATLTHTDDAANLNGWSEKLIQYLEGKARDLDLPLDIQGTAFERRVWDELRAIPYGERRTYTQVASALGQPKASRAVGSACASNPVSLVIPCHRVVRTDGSLGGYGGGLERKRRLLAMECG